MPSRSRRGQDTGWRGGAMTFWLLMIFAQILGAIAIHLWYDDTSILLYMGYIAVCFIFDGLWFVFFVTRSTNDDTTLLKGLFSWQMIVVILVLCVLIYLYLQITSWADGFSLIPDTPEVPDWDWDDFNPFRLIR